MELRLSSSVEAMGTSPERDNPDGYWDEMGVDERLDVLSKIEGITGLFTFYPSTTLPSDPNKMLKKLADHNLKPHCSVPSPPQ